MSSPKRRGERPGFHRTPPARRTFADDAARAVPKGRPPSLFVKLDERWATNAKLRRVGPGSVLLFLELVALVGRRGRAGILTAEDLDLARSELAPWLQAAPLTGPLEELEQAGLVVLVEGGVELAGWTREEWGAGWRTGGEPCPRCRGARTVDPGFKSCGRCREIDRARWAVRSGRSEEP